MRLEARKKTATALVGLDSAKEFISQSVRIEGMLYQRTSPCLSLSLSVFFLCRACVDVSRQEGEHEGQIVHLLIKR